MIALSIFFFHFLDGVSQTHLDTQHMRMHSKIDLKFKIKHDNFTLVFDVVVDVDNDVVVPMRYVHNRFVVVVPDSRLNVYIKRDFTRSLVTKKIAFCLGDMRELARALGLA